MNVDNHQILPGWSLEVEALVDDWAYGKYDPAGTFGLRPGFWKVVGRPIAGRESALRFESESRKLFAKVMEAKKGPELLVAGTEAVEISAYAEAEDAKRKEADKSRAPEKSHLRAKHAWAHLRILGEVRSSLGDQPDLRYQELVARIERVRPKVLRVLNLAQNTFAAQVKSHPEGCKDLQREMGQMTAEAHESIWHYAKNPSQAVMQPVELVRKTLASELFESEEQAEQVGNALEKLVQAPESLTKEEYDALVSALDRELNDSPERIKRAIQGICAYLALHHPERVIDSLHSIVALLASEVTDGVMGGICEWVADTIIPLYFEEVDQVPLPEKDVEEDSWGTAVTAANWLLQAGHAVRNPLRFALSKAQSHYSKQCNPNERAAVLAAILHAYWANGATEAVAAAGVLRQGEQPIKNWVQAPMHSYMGWSNPTKVPGMVKGWLAGQAGRVKELAREGAYVDMALRASLVALGALVVIAGPVGLGFAAVTAPANIPGILLAGWGYAMVAPELVGSLTGALDQRVNMQRRRPAREEAVDAIRIGSREGELAAVQKAVAASNHPAEVLQANSAKLKRVDSRALKALVSDLTRLQKRGRLPLLHRMLQKREGRSLAKVIQEALNREEKAIEIRGIELLEKVAIAGA